MQEAAPSDIGRGGREAVECRARGRSDPPRTSRIVTRPSASTVTPQSASLEPIADVLGGEMR